MLFVSPAVFATHPSNKSISAITSFRPTRRYAGELPGAGVLFED
jgi:hypothetical protein